MVVPTSSTSYIIVVVVVCCLLASSNKLTDIIIHVVVYDTQSMERREKMTSSSVRKTALAVIATLSLAGHTTEGFYLPGVNPHSFKQGDE